MTKLAAEDFDLSTAEWQRPVRLPEAADALGVPEWANVTGPDGQEYLLLRNSEQPEVIQVYTKAERDAFILGARNHEFPEQAP